MDSIAIIGYSFKFPGACNDDASFWDLLENGRNVMSPWPESRANIDAFYDPKASRPNTLQSRGAHFVEGDPAVFDAPFFSLSSSEATSMDPQQRWLLEASYRALENAGLPVEKVSGSETSVFVASMSTDFAYMVSKDADLAPINTATGTTPSIQANRLSWYFNLKGPSMQVNTACSSSMIAVDLACQSLRNHQCSMSMVAGANVLLNPEASLSLSNMGFLSPDSLCYSFDERANGYSRGEGVVVILLKRLLDAVRDGDMIRAVVRGTDTNQDGYTPGITQPSASSQEALIRKVYKKNNLDFDSTRYVEAHGTGTQIGDATEMAALGRVFRHSRSSTDPLYVGSIKANIGHLEGSSGLAGIMKGIFMLEKGLIPPNALFQKINPRINNKLYNIKVPTSLLRWPSTGLRRISINSFGFGGSNGHIIMDDTYHTLESLFLRGLHRSVLEPPAISGKINAQLTNGNGHSCTNADVDSLCLLPEIPNGNGHNGTYGHADLLKAMPQSSGPKLLLWTAKDESALKRVLQQYFKHYENRSSGFGKDLEALSYTLAARRSLMSWRSFTVVDSETDPAAISRSAANASRQSRLSTLAFVFTGQGAQYADMGIELLQYPIFRSTLTKINHIFAQLGAEWNLFEKIQCHSEIHKPQFSQPICTALQIGLVELLRTFNIVPSAIIGHSSGEIALAYCAGSLSLQSACKVAYHRGRLVAELVKSTERPAAMISVNLEEGQVDGVLAEIPLHNTIHVACINSPSNVTLSGEESDIDLLKDHLDSRGIFAQKLKTGVAYHSPAMGKIAEEYLFCLDQLDEGNAPEQEPLLVSSVTGQKEAKERFTEATYWVENLVSQVRFSDALNYIATAAPMSDGLSDITDYLEVGPHAALKRPLNDTLSQVGDGKGRRYFSLLQRQKSPIRSIMEASGSLFCQGYPVSILTVNRQSNISHPAPFITDTPPYPFDHSQSYWHETRLSKGWRLRETTKSSLLGFRATDCNPLEPRWRKILSVKEMPWIADHVVEETIYFPATGSLAIAVEACKQIDDKSKVISGYKVKDAIFKAPITIPANDGKTELVTQLYRLHQSHTKARPRYKVCLYTCDEDHWNECFSAIIQVEHEGIENEVDGSREALIASEELHSRISNAEAMCNINIQSSEFYAWHEDQGLKYGPAFAVAEDIRWDGEDLSISSVDVGAPTEPFAGIFHPALLDASCQACFVSPSRGMSKKLPTIIPHKVSEAWVSATGWQYPDTSRIRTVTNSGLKATSTGIDASFTVYSDSEKLLCHAKHVEMLPVKGDVESVGSNERMLFHSIDWKPQLSLLTPEQLRAYCKVDRFEDDEKDTIKYHQRVKDASLAAIRFNLDQLKRIEWSKAPPHMKKYFQWMERELERTPVDLLTKDALYQELDKVEALRPSAKMFMQIAKNLMSICSGETDVVQLLFSTSLAQDHYDTLFQPMDNHKLESFIKILAHETPNQRILEVGAGTGGMTNVILSYLKKVEDDIGGIAFAEYSYTDISTGFFEKAHERFAEFEDRMAFKVLDLEKDVSAQGYELQCYDVIFAGSVLHATRSLKDTLCNLGKLLKPQGKLVFHETTTPECFQMGFGFGPLPGWWVSEEKFRQWGPTITDPEWDRVLRENGFSGNDMVIRDFNDSGAYMSSLIVSTIDQVPGNTIERSKVLFVVADQDDYKVALSRSIGGALMDKSRMYEYDTVIFEDLEPLRLSTAEYVIFLAENSSRFLADLSERSFKTLKSCLNFSKNLLWVSIPRDSSNSYERIEFATAGLKDGFLRTLRSEYQSKRIISLTFPETALPISAAVEKIMSVFLSAFENQSPEEEYLIAENMIFTGRLVQERNINQEMHSYISPQPKKENLLPGPPLKVEIEKRGSIETLRYVEDPVYYRPLGANEVEIEARAWGVSFRDVFLALGRLDESEGFGTDCAGIVTRVGSSCTFLKPGDRVVMASVGCMRMYPRDQQDALCTIPDSVSFEEACSILNAGCTAYHSLLEIARLQKGEKVLIHSGSGATGQLAIQIAQMIGAEIFATVGYDYKKQLLLEEYGIPEDHVFYSRDTSFAQSLKRATGGYGVDVILNSIVGDGLLASWECIAPYGRFIEIGKVDIQSNSMLPMAHFAKNITFSAVDLRHLALHRKDLARVLLSKVMELTRQGKIHAPRPIHTFGLESIQESFRYLQSGKSTGRIVIKVDASTKIEKYITHERAWTFDSQATYFVVGGLGGIGRSILKWMAGRGAKHIVAPTRSGLTSEAAISLVATLRSNGINIVTPKCDVSSKQSLAGLLEECKATVPPIRGCINAAMALEDSIYDNMSHYQWQSTIRSKFDSSLNLHNLLGDDLDFFVLLSSVAGVMGNISQSNYAAGCTFQDALARYRVSQGQRGIAIDLGLMRTIGVVAEREELHKNFDGILSLTLIEESEFLAIMDMCCNPANSAVDAKSQIIMGLVTPADKIAAGMEVEEILDRPLLSHFSRPRHMTSSQTTADSINYAAIFRQASSLEERVNIVVQSLAMKLAKSLSMDPSEIETEQPVYAYGVDSLVAIELRNWISKEFAADVPVFEIMSGKSVADLGDFVTKASHIVFQKS